ncbi:MAG: hypothetical protein MI753_14870 [Hyphomicrobiales bacterium]|nr:hypothetical protein [Hyphomicrobiales bacterium]
MNNSMLSDADLELGIAEGIISVDQAERLKALAAQRRGEAVTYASGDEPFRLFRGFRDFFLALGLLLLGSGAASLGVWLTGNWHRPDTAPLIAVAIWLGFAGIAWLFAEWITRRLRLPLSSIVILGFVAGVAGIAGGFLTFVPAPSSVPPEGMPLTVAFLAALAATVLFYWRFRLPFALFAIAATLAGTALAFTFWNYPDWAEANSRIVAGLVGLAVFIAALSYDIRDPRRLTRFSECGLWLHMLAAPLLVHAAVGGVQHGLDIQSFGEATRIFLFVSLLSGIALLIDRRALLASSLIYLGAAVYATISGAGLSDDLVIILTLMSIGGFVVLLGTAWTAIRNLFIGLLPEGRFRDALPPIRP